jgi:hypothetical protein
LHPQNGRQGEKEEEVPKKLQVLVLYNWCFRTSKNKRSIEHLQMPPALTPVTHGKELPVKKISESLTLGDDDETGLDNTEKEVDGTGHDKKYVQPDSANPI